MLKKYIGDRKFYATVMAVAVPIMIQNAITNFVGMLDNIMVGQVGTAQMSGVAIVNQLLFVFNLCIFGAVWEFSPLNLRAPRITSASGTPFASRFWCACC